MVRLWCQRKRTDLAKFSFGQNTIIGSSATRTLHKQTNDVLFNLLDSHDTKRLRSDTKNLDQYFAQLAVLDRKSVV